MPHISSDGRVSTGYTPMVLPAADPGFQAIAEATIAELRGEPRTEEGEPSSAGNNSSPSTTTPPPNSNAKPTSGPSPAPTTANPSATGPTANSGAPSTAGPGTAPQE